MGLCVSKSDTTSAGIAEYMQPANLQVNDTYCIRPVCNFQGGFGCVLFYKNLAEMIRELVKHQDIVKITLYSYTGEPPKVYEAEQVYRFFSKISNDTIVKLFFRQEIHGVTTNELLSSSHQLLNEAGISLKNSTTIEEYEPNFAHGKLEIGSSAKFVLYKEKRDKPIESQSIYFSLQKFCKSGDLNMYVNHRDSQGPISWEHLKVHVLPTLCKLHSKNIVHMDIKPENMLVCDGQVFLSDFDDINKCDTSFTDMRSFGTYMYMSPHYKYIIKHWNKDIFPRLESDYNNHITEYVDFHSYMSDSGFKFVLNIVIENDIYMKQNLDEVFGFIKSSKYISESKEKTFRNAYDIHIGTFRKLVTNVSDKTNEEDIVTLILKKNDEFALLLSMIETCDEASLKDPKFVATCNDLASYFSFTPKDNVCTRARLRLPS